MNILFEVADLNKASPGTVGRCGIIFLEPTSLGWRPLKQSFLDILPTSIFAADQIASIDDMFEWLVPATFNYLQHGKDMTLSIPYSELHLFSSMLRIFRAVLGIDEAVEKEKLQKQQAAKGKAGGEKGAAATASATASEALQPVDTIHVQVLLTLF